MLMMFGGLEGAYLAVAPDSEDARGDNPYQLTYTVSEWTEEATLTLSDGDTQTFEVTIDDTMTGVVIAELKITYSDTGETFTAACDEVVTTPDYMGHSSIPLARKAGVKRGICGYSVGNLRV